MKAFDWNLKKFEAALEAYAKGWEYLAKKPVIVSMKNKSKGKYEKAIEGLTIPDSDELASNPRREVLLRIHLFDYMTAHGWKLNLVKDEFYQERKA